MKKEWQRIVFLKKLLVVTTLEISSMWYEILGHMANLVFHHILTTSNINIIKSSTKLFCESRELTNLHKQSFPSCLHVISHLPLIYCTWIFGALA